MSPPNSPRPVGERLARLEVQIDQLLLTAARAHADLRDHIDLQRKLLDAQHSRIGALEKSAEETRTHLKWMKAIWLALHGAILAFLGLK